MLQALRVAAQVRPWLDASGRGEVHSIFRRVCNLAWGDWLITLHTAETGKLPGGVMVHGDVDFRALGLRPGLPVLWKPEEQSLYVGSLPVSLLHASPLPLCGNVVATLGDLEANRGVLWDLVRGHGRGAVWAQQPVGQLVWERGSRLCESLLRGEPLNVGQLLGLGEGLTPSGDDVLLGIMAVLYYSGRGLGLLGPSVDELAPAATTRVSSNYLRLGVRGAFSERLDRAATALLEGRADIRDSVLRLLDSGHSSGTDTAAGLYLGMSMLIEGRSVA